MGVLSAETSATPPSADLPGLLQFKNGDTVESNEDWTQRKSEIRDLMESTFTGSIPKTPPKLIGFERSELSSPDDDFSKDRFLLKFQTDEKRDFEFEIEVRIPNDLKAPAPLLLTQPRYYQIPWAEEALRRGYVVCLYPGVDAYHREEDFPGYDSVWKEVRAAYPFHTWTEIAVKGWIAGRALDFLLDPANEFPIHPDQIGIIGFSRYGKQSLIATAMDSRIQCVVARSPGSPGSSPYRFTSRDTFAEAPSDFPGDWFLPSLRDYLGREDELPIDAHGWYGLIAPRHCLIHTAHNDGSEPTFAVERAYIQGREVYDFFKHPERLRVDYRSGQHGPITEAQVVRNLDWMDVAFGRGSGSYDDFPEELLHQFDWDVWKQKQTSTALCAPAAVNVESTRQEIQKNLRWLLGESPVEWRTEQDTEPAFITDAESEMMTHDRWRVAPVQRTPIQFGSGVKGNLYFNPEFKEPQKVVIWLHPLSYHSGYNEGYGVEGTTVYHRLAKEGLAVLAFDQCGFGLRLLEGTHFYERHPKSSRMGRMVADIQSAVDAITGGTLKHQGEIPELKSDSIYLLGYSVGGAAGVFAAALDDRIAGVACFSGLTPFRSMKANEDGYPGLEFWYDWHALIPKLGMFAENPEKTPVDFGEVLKLVDPRPCLIASPTRDRFARHDDVKLVIQTAKTSKLWETDGLSWSEPDDVQRFQSKQHAVFLEWLKSLD